MGAALWLDAVPRGHQARTFASTTSLRPTFPLRWLALILFAFALSGSPRFRWRTQWMSSGNTRLRTHVESRRNGQINRGQINRD